ncbi:phage portal protein [bacterium]|nr:MAG: phage portal protein [bacterium]
MPPTYESNGLNVEAITWALKALRLKTRQYKRARDYYKGKHPLSFVTAKFRAAFADALCGMKANLMPPFVDIPANRLGVKAFAAKGAKLGATDGERLALDAWDTWELNRMDVRAFDVMHEALLCGDSYVIVWPDEEITPGEMTPILYPHDAGTCAVEYHPERPGYVIRGAKWWLENKRVRLTIYTANEVEKYISTGPATSLPSSAGAFQRFEIEGEEWPLENPYDKCPVFHFRNGKEGKSQLHDIEDGQNALNLTLCNMLVAMEFFSFPQRYVLGFDPANSAAEGELTEWKSAMDRIWFHWDKETQMGQFDPSDPSAFLNVMREFRSLMNEIAGIPPHYFSMSGAPPSGVALAILETRLNDLIDRLKIAWGNVWADVMLFAAKVRGTLPDGVRMVADWKDGTPKDTKAEAEAASALQGAGVSRKGSLTRIGMTEAEYQKNEDERDAETAKATPPVAAAPPAASPPAATE